MSSDRFECAPHLDVTEELHADTVARLGYFPNVQSLRVSLDLSSRPAFQFHAAVDMYGSAPLRSGLTDYNSSVLEAAVSIRYLRFLTMEVDSGDCFCHLPWQNLPHLCELRVKVCKRIAQGTFGFLPRLPSLEVLRADIDFFSVRCLRFLTHLTSLDLSIEPPEHGFLDASQARERNNEALLQIARLPKLETLNFYHPASMFAIAGLTALPKLTDLQLLLQPNSQVAVVSPWDVQRLFQENPFHLQHLHFEFKLGDWSGLATLSNVASHHASKLKSEMQFPVPWSVDPVCIVPLKGSRQSAVLADGHYDPSHGAMDPNEMGYDSDMEPN